MNLKSLAMALGISKTTVSRALNGYPEVNCSTRERVLAAAREAGYVANPMARSLAVGRSNVIGIICPLLPANLGDPMFLGVVGGMAEALEASSMNLIIAPVSANNELPSYQQMVRGRRVDGLVVGSTLVHDERIAYLIKSGFPFVAHGRTGLNAPHAWFDYDNHAGIRLASACLLGLGHQRIALISSALELNSARQRKDGFIAAMKDAGLALDPRHLIADAQDRRSGYQAMQQLLACSPRPSAVIIDNHLAGVGAARALLDAGIAIGRDISLITWGSVEDTSSGLSVTMIAQPEPRRVGAQMVAMLLALLAGRAPSTLQVLWQPTLAPGASTGPHLLN